MPKPSASSDDWRAWVALEHLVLKEQIPGPVMSDSAANFLLDKLTEIAQEIGHERFHAMMVRAIETCERRPVLATFRKLAGLNDRLDIQQAAVAAAWDIVTRVVRRHISFDGNGNIVMQAHLEAVGEGGHRQVPVPEIPDGVKSAIMALGGWAAMSESYPTWWTAKFATFKELLRLSPEEITALTAPRSTALSVK